MISDVLSQMCYGWEFNLQQCSQPGYTFGLRAGVCYGGDFAVQDGNKIFHYSTSRVDCYISGLCIWFCYTQQGCSGPEYYCLDGNMNCIDCEDIDTSNLSIQINGHQIYSWQSNFTQSAAVPFDHQHKDALDMDPMEQMQVPITKSPVWGRRPSKTETSRLTKSPVN